MVITVTSFQIFSDSVKGLMLYDGAGCQGAQYEFLLTPAGSTNGYFPYVGDEANNKASSGKYHACDWELLGNSNLRL